MPLLEHVLDNPIWNALISGNKPVALGGELAKYYPKEMGAFAGLEKFAPENFQSLYDLTPSDVEVVLFTPGKIQIPPNWQTYIAKPLLQLVYASPQPPAEQGAELVALQEQHVPAMIALTALTKPGPFLSRTIDFGDYNGIFEGDRLVAMAGERLRPEPYTEISAVCTHPEALGRGYAGKLILNQVRKIMAASGKAFLHVLPENTPALSLYLKLGFEVRKEMMIYKLEKKIKP
ncbi:MAG: GNAT family N-acetyltransferase [Adhaeribacter sp.]